MVDLLTHLIKEVRCSPLRFSRKERKFNEGSNFATALVYTNK